MNKLSLLHNYPITSKNATDISTNANHSLQSIQAQSVDKYPYSISQLTSSTALTTTKCIEVWFKL